MKRRYEFLGLPEELVPDFDREFQRAIVSFGKRRKIPALSVTIGEAMTGFDESLRHSSDAKPVPVSNGAVRKANYQELVQHRLVVTQGENGSLSITLYEGDEVLRCYLNVKYKDLGGVLAFLAIHPEVSIETNIACNKIQALLEATISGS